MTPNRDTIFFQILQEQKDQHLTVTDVRNEILRRDKSIKLDKAVLRRWVNGKFVTLVRRGTLSRHGNERGKVYYIFASQRDKDLRLDALSEGAPLKEPISRAVPLPYDAIKEELSEYRLKAITQMSEIEEYKRIVELYPDLRSLVSQMFDVAVDENCRVIGKIRALEQLLMRQETL